MLMLTGLLTWPHVWMSSYVSLSRFTWCCILVALGQLQTVVPVLLPHPHSKGHQLQAMPLLQVKLCCRSCQPSMED
jgi:hypothetical protein